MGRVECSINNCRRLRPKAEDDGGTWRSQPVCRLPMYVVFYQIPPRGQLNIRTTMLCRSSSLAIATSTSEACRRRGTFMPNDSRVVIQSTHLEYVVQETL